MLSEQELADLVFTDSLFQRVGAVMEKEQDEKVVVAMGWWKRSAADERKFLVSWYTCRRLLRYADYSSFFALKVSVSSLKTTCYFTGSSSRKTGGAEVARNEICNEVRNWILQGMDFAKNAYACSLNGLCCVCHNSVDSSVWPAIPVYTMGEWVYLVFKTKIKRVWF